MSNYYAKYVVEYQGISGEWLREDAFNSLEDARQCMVADQARHPYINYRIVMSQPITYSPGRED